MLVPSKKQRWSQVDGARSEHLPWMGIVLGELKLVLGDDVCIFVEENKTNRSAGGQ